MVRFPSRLSRSRWTARKRARWVRRVGFPLLLIPLVVAACSFPGAVRPTLKIGLVAPFEGRYRYVGYDAIYAVKLALQEANEDGGVGGYGVQLVAYDDEADPTMAVEQARKLAVDPDVVAAIGHFQEETTVAVVGAYADAGMPLVAPAVLGVAPGDAGTGVYRLGPTAEPIAEALLERAFGLAAPGDVLLLGEGGPLGDELVRGAQERTGEPLEVASAVEEGWEEDVLARDPAVVLVDLDPVRAGEVVSLLRQRGWAGRVVGGPALAPADFVAVAGEAAAGAAFVTPWSFPGDVSGGDAFAAAYRSVSGGAEPGPLALPAYEATWILLEALERAAASDGATREGVSAILSNAERRGPLERLTIGQGRAWTDLGLTWYRIGADGVPELQE